MIWKLFFIQIYILTITHKSTSYVLFAGNIDDFRTLAKKIIPGHLADQIADMADKSNLNYRQSGKGNIYDVRDEGKTRYVIKNKQKVEDLDLDDLVKRVKEKLVQEYKFNDKTGVLNEMGDNKLKYVKDFAINDEKLPSIDDYYYKDDTMNINIDDDKSKGPSSLEFVPDKAAESSYENDSQQEIDYDNDYDQRNENNDGRIKIHLNNENADLNENTQSVVYVENNENSEIMPIVYEDENSADYKENLEDTEKAQDHENLEDVEIEQESDNTNKGSVDLTYDSQKVDQQVENESEVEYMDQHDKNYIDKNDGKYIEEVKDYINEKDGIFDNQHVGDKEKLNKIKLYDDTHEKYTEETSNNNFKHFEPKVILKTTKMYDYDKTNKKTYKIENNQVNSTEIKEVPVYYDEDLPLDGNNEDLLKEVNLNNNKDSYEDYVTPKKENIFASDETTITKDKLQTKSKFVYHKAKTENLTTHTNFHNKLTTQTKSTKAKNAKELEIKAKTESLWYDEAKIEENFQVNGTKTIKKLKGTMIPTREFYKMSSPNYAKIKAVAEKYNFNEPLPEKDRERENIKHIGNPPASINKKVVLK